MQKNYHYGAPPFLNHYNKVRGLNSMKNERIEMLRIGKICADRWWHHTKSIILSKQHIEAMKKATSTAK
ncbi:hypothetical protein [Candidatus Enterococcus ferrettii]|uniref:hypothetical protein n=1 Tax=Candidatus Enterococcus ferrettii TaxID=2815324 RepID=UPI001A9B16B8|nr:hypothetical protein [Enterococcus sp. 665A]MBO1342115.1 hypothetical protein [Enterococcus sp. 665A]